MYKWLIVLIIGLLNPFSGFLRASNELAQQVINLNASINQASAELEKNGSLTVLGNSSLSEAKIIFLPEIHDDPESLYMQLKLLADGHKKHPNLTVLDESLASLKQSSWDLYSQKAIEILAARSQKQSNVQYSPKQFENKLGELARIFKKMPGELNRDEEFGLWKLRSIESKALPFFGWDSPKSTSMATRNQSMINTLETLEKEKPDSPVYVMLGARHIPYLEFLTSQSLLCQKSRSDNVGPYFEKIQTKHGLSPELPFGIGSTTALYRYLSNKKYAIAFSNQLYGELKNVMSEFKQRQGGNCFDL
jgi:hypothetical protein